MSPLLTTDPASGPWAFIARLLGIEDVRSIDAIEPGLAAPWAHGGPAWLFFGCLGLAVLATVFYLRWQSRGRRRVRFLLATLRAALLCLLVTILAEPVVTLKITSSPKPHLWLLLDGTESMAIRDGAPLEAASAPVPSPSPGAAAGPERPSRSERLGSAILAGPEGPFARLARRFRVRSFIFDRPDGVRAVGAGEEAGADDAFDPERLAGELTTAGPLTAIGAAIQDLGRRHLSGSLAGLVIVSDFDQNSGTGPVEAARALGVPVHTLGVGPLAATDLGVDLQAPLLLKKGERSSLLVTIRQSGLEGRSVGVVVRARRLSAETAGGSGEGAFSVPGGASGGEYRIAERAVELRGPIETLEIPWVPEETGRFLFSAEVPPLEGEVIDQNNRAEREASIRDDFLRLMFVEYEPTWEWRFIKEVFHRDRLVGMRGFRTFLRSADPRVRQTNELFLPTLTPQRSEFFQNDVIFLGDMPAATLSGRFCELTKEFVSKFGGGLVVLSGPRFGPGQLAQTPLAEMLPVVVDPDARLKDAREFRLRFRPEAESFEFLQLGDSPEESSRAWESADRFPWYQPVDRAHPLATVLVEHPTDTCSDGKTPQPIIAVRRYGKGEVIYLALDETWRLRRKHGERYYRQFWGQMIHRLGLSHALGSQKRFVVRTDRRQYRVDEKALLTVEAYDANYEPLAASQLPQGKLAAEMVLSAGKGGGAETVQSISIPELRDGVFETEIPLFTGGEHRVSVKDPITGETVFVHFQVTDLSVERRSAVRNGALERELAVATGGLTGDLERAGPILDAIQAPSRTETSIRVIPLWNTWLVFGLVVALMLSEWALRKLVHLS